MPSNNSFRRPWMFTNVDDPSVNQVWLAEYMAQHDLSLEVALEHLSKKMRDFVAEAKATADAIDRSDDALLAECRAFVNEYKPMKDFYSPIPRVKMFKDEE